MEGTKMRDELWHDLGWLLLAVILVGWVLEVIL